MQARIALVRPVSAALAQCELSFVAREPIDVARAQAQHAAYCGTLAGLGCQVVELPALDDAPDAVFVEDTAIVLDGFAIATRPGAESRRGEVASMAGVLAAYREVHAIEAPATVDGGDVLLVGDTLYVGQSARTNAEAVAQLRALLQPHGVAVVPVATRECLHLKSAVTCIGDGLLLLQPEWVDASVFGGMRVVRIDPDEPHAANALRVGDAVVYPQNFPRTEARLRDLGIEVHTVDVSELQKAEGAVTCCSVVFRPVLHG